MSNWYAIRSPPFAHWWLPAACLGMRLACGPSIIHASSRRRASGKRVSPSTATRSTHGAAMARGLARSRPSFRSRRPGPARDLAEIQADTRPNVSGNFVTESRCFDLAYTSRARSLSAPTDIE